MPNTSKKEHQVGDLVYTHAKGLGQITKKYDINVHRNPRPTWSVYNYDIYWFRDGTTVTHFLNTTITSYKRRLKHYVATRRKVD